MVDELKPCPFCGGEAELTGHQAPEFWVLCPTIGCKASSEGFGDKKRAIAAWNTRHPAPPTGGMKPWLGGDSAPDDWDGRGAIGRHGAWIASDGIYRWTHEGNGADIVAYTARPAPPTDEQVEAAARAIAKLYQDVPGDARAWRYWVQEARAALEAAGSMK